MDELEIIPHHQISDIRIFVNKVEYRSPHFHPDWELIWTLDAPMTIRGAHHQYLIQPGELVLLPPNYPHELKKLDQPCTFLCIQIAVGAAPSIANLRTDSIRLADHLTPGDIRWIKEQLLDTARDLWLREPYHVLFCYSQCGLILHRILKQVPARVLSAEELASTEQKNARLTRLVQFVDEHYMHKIRLADFARQEGKSVSYMSHFVRDALNQTFQDYVTSVRFNHAKSLIAEGKQSLISISVAAGFSDYRYFSRVFQETYGMTPAEYRQQSHAALPGAVLPSRSVTSQEEILSISQSLDILKVFQSQLSDTPLTMP